MLLFRPDQTDAAPTAPRPNLCRKQSNHKLPYRLIATRPTLEDDYSWGGFVGAPTGTPYGGLAIRQPVSLKDETRGAAMFNSKG